MSKKKILITGATGFVGKNWLDYSQYIASGHQIISLGRQKDALPLDLNQFFAEIDTVIHLAGKAHDLKNASKPEEYYEVNYELTKRIYDSFLKSEARRFIFMSSVKAVADKVDGKLDEMVIPDPKTSYGKSKLMAEEYIQKQLLPAGKNYYILRPCMIHGPGNKGNLNLLFKIAQAGLPYPLIAFQNERSFLTVENLCFVINELIKRTDIPTGIYNVADNEPLSTNRVMEIICEELSKKTKLFRVNKNIIRFIARLGDILPLPLNSERLNKLTENYVVSNQKIITAINTSLPLDSEAGLRKTIQSFIHGC